MKDFAELIEKIDTTNKTNRKVEALANYFKKAPSADKVWTIAILSHRRPRRPVNTKTMREWASEFADIPLWLFEESYHIVGDLAETIALVLPRSETSAKKNLNQFLTEIIDLKPKSEADKKQYLRENWSNLNYYQSFVFNKLMTGSFRIGVSQKFMTRALSKATGIDEDILAFKLMGNWKPSEISFENLILKERPEDYLSKPYPFYLAYALDDGPQDLGDVEQWSAEHKWDGIRAQLIIRKGQLFTWSRGEELVTHRFPEFEAFVDKIPDGTVIDGEILPYPKGKIGTFKDLQKRLGRKNITKNLLKKIPVILKVYDLLEWQGEDIRKENFAFRRKKLEQLYSNLSEKELPLQLSESLSFSNWDEVATERGKAREKKSEGLMLKRLDSPYLVGRKKGDWWKWKTDPLTIDGVLTYAMRGHGRRSNLFTDYTFGLWDDDKNELVTFAKAYSGLTDKEFKKVDNWIKKNTVERFGPVRSVRAHHVFEIAFENIARSKRHKSGVATRFPRIVRWRLDKPIEEANTLQDLWELLPEEA
jgi:DNA ligase-1